MKELQTLTDIEEKIEKRKIARKERNRSFGSKVKYKH